jgi:hypothetical protein
MEIRGYSAAVDLDNLSFFFQLLYISPHGIERHIELLAKIRSNHAIMGVDLLDY